MGKEDINKNLYKITLVVLKFLPMTVAFSFMLNTLCAYYQVPFQIVTHYLGITIAPLLFMYLTSTVFHFCNYHRIFIHYIAIVELFNLTDWYFGIPISNKDICLIHIWVSIVFIICAIIMYINKKKQIKICK